MRDPRDRRVGELNAATPIVFGAVEGEVGVLYDAFDRLSTAAVERDPDAHADLDLLALKLEWGAGCVDESLAELSYLGEVADVLAQDAKLVTAHSSDKVAGTHSDAEALRNLNEQLVAGTVAERVVDVLEPVEVEEHDRGGRVMSSGAAEGLLGDLIEERTVR